ncbi:putative BUD22 family protein C4F10.06 [Glarea lozoyensis 74030]|nr:putative BUD22 family protein C4F10.06 [Glarea lozoyensis 74030]
MVEDYLYRTICKVKRMVESEALPEEVKEKGTKKEGDGEVGSPEEKLAKMNVMSGMFNTPNVKVVMADQMRGLYMVMRIPMPEKVAKGKAAGSKKEKTEEEPLKGILKTKSKSSTRVQEAGSDIEMENLSDVGDVQDARNSRFADFSGEESSQSEDEDALAIQSRKERRAITKDEREDGFSGSESGSFSKYDALLGSSDSESDAESSSELRFPKTSESSHNPSLSLSPPAKRTSTKSRSKPKPPPPKSTTFLPSLLGGYFSGSESSASDLDDDAAPVVRKNRPGQNARRAIWEKKFGTGANHIKSGQGSVRRDEGWDSKRGADPGRGRGRGRGGFGGSSGFAGRATGENAVAPLEKRAGKKDDVGVLHPSWQAAKKAKEEKKAAKFEGKKVVFD